ncbi:MAG: hypothetical protein ACETWR_04925 [Anaerolineae bacterium]
MGLDKFAESMKEQAAETMAVEWRPGAEVPHLVKTKSGVDIDEANAEAVRRICAGRPMLIGMGIARDTLPGMGERMILHAGPHRHRPQGAGHRHGGRGVVASADGLF